MSSEKYTDLLTTAQLAKRWRTTSGSLATQRWNGRGPAFVRLGRAVFYDLAVVTAYEKAHGYQLGHKRSRKRAKH